MCFHVFDSSPALAAISPQPRAFHHSPSAESTYQAASIKQRPETKEAMETKQAF
jgi:hypothetical protein